MIESERARLLALDRRLHRGPHPPTISVFNVSATLRQLVKTREALRDLLAWHDRPPEGWTAAMLRRLDEIRALAAL